MPLTAWKTFATLANVTRTGGSVNWTNPTRAQTNNNSYSTCALVANGSHCLRGLNPAFTTTDIPSGSTINGIECRVGAFQTVGTITGTDIVYARFQIVNASAVVGTASDVVGHLPTTETIVSRSNTQAVWGTSLTDTNVRSTTFGFAFAFFDSDYATTTVSVDYLEIRIDYTAPISARRRAGFL